MSDFKLADAEKASIVEEVKHYLDDDLYEFCIYFRKFRVVSELRVIGGLGSATPENFALIKKELCNVKAKHPHFIDMFTASNATDSDIRLENRRAILHNRISLGATSFIAVLSCEIEEAINAYAHGELEHARQELAQCAAVCVRGMEYIQAEIDKRAEKEG